MLTKQYKLLYKSQSPFGGEDRYIYAHGHSPELADDGWEKWSLPIGNGYMGANVFGRTLTERIQITENSLSNPCLSASIIVGTEFMEYFASNTS